MNKILLIAGGILIVGASVVFVLKQNKVAPIISEKNEQTATTTKPFVSAQPAKTDSGTTMSFPPAGWYIYTFKVGVGQVLYNDFTTFSNLPTSWVLYETKILPECRNTGGDCFGQSISMYSSTTTLGADEFISAKIKNIGRYDSQEWGTVNGHKISSIIYTSEVTGEPVHLETIFSGNIVYEFRLSHTSEKNLKDFQDVVSYSAKNIVRK